MTTTTSSTISELGRRAAAEPLAPRPGRFARYLRETGLLVARGLRTIPRVPERLSDVTIQPILFTLLFLYVFGSAIHITGIRYEDYLLPRPARPEHRVRRRRGRGGHRQRLLQRSRGPVPLAARHPNVGDLRPGDRPDHRTDPRHSDRRRDRSGPRLAPRPRFGAGLRTRGPGAARAVRFHLVRGADGDAGPQRRRRAGDRLRRHAAPVVPGRHVRADLGDEADPTGHRRVGPPIRPGGSLSPHLSRDDSHGSLQLEHPVAATVGWCLLIIAICVPLALRRFRTANA